MGRVALFIGYSLSDVSVRYLLYRLHKLWRGSSYAHARPKTYVYMGRPNPVQARVLESWGIVPLFSDGDVGEGLCQLLATLQRDAAATGGTPGPAAPVKAAARTAKRPRRKPRN